MNGHNLSAKHLFYDEESPVRWGCATKLKKFVKEHARNEAELTTGLKSGDELSKEINLGTHTFKPMKKIGEYHYHLSRLKMVYSMQISWMSLDQIRI